MAFGDLRKRLAKGDTVPLGWISTPSPENAVTVAKAGFEAVCIDMQHAPISVETVSRGVAGIIAAGATAIVRPPLMDAGSIGSALDAGAEAVIAPMINTEADAKWLAHWSKFAPVGARSWGPAGAIRSHGMSLSHYLATANDAIATFAMIETREALANMDDILAVDGIDGIFVGPNDLCVSLTNGDEVDPRTETAINAIKEIGSRTREAGKFAGIFAISDALAVTYRDMGYQLIVLHNDINQLTRGAQAAIAALER